MGPSEPEATKLPAMPDEPSTPEICDRPTGRGCGTSRMLHAKQGAGVPGDHQVFVGFDNIGTDAAGVSRDAGPVRLVGRLVQLDAEPSAGAADRDPDRCGVLTDTGGEDDPVKPTERRR